MSSSHSVAPLSFHDAAVQTNSSRSFDGLASEFNLLWAQLQAVHQQEIQAVQIQSKFPMQSRPTMLSEANMTAEDLRMTKTPVNSEEGDWHGNSSSVMGTFLHPSMKLSGHNGVLPTEVPPLRDAWNTVSGTVSTVHSEMSLSDFGALRSSLANAGNASSAVFLSETVSSLPACHFVARVYISPVSNTRASWETFGAIALVYDLLLTPMRMAFSLPDVMWMDACDWLVRLYWTADIFLSCVTGFLEHGHVEMSPRRILCHYLKGWFAFDIILVALDWSTVVVGLELQTPKLSRFAKLFKFIRSARLLRMVKSIAAMTELLDRLASHMVLARFVVFKWAMLFLAILHIFACGWRGMASLGNHRASWLVQVMSSESGNPLLQYLISLQWTLAHFGVGTTDVVARTVPERAYATVLMIFALLAVSSLMSVIVNAFHTAHLRHAQVEEDLRKLRRYLRQHRVPSELARRVIRQVTFRAHQQKTAIHFEDVKLLDVVSDSLKAEVDFSMWAPFLRHNPLLEQLCDLATRMMMRVCREAISSSNLTADDCVFYKGTVSTHMVFVVAGRLQYRRTVPVEGLMQTDVSADLQEWICEVALWSTWVHLGSLKATTDCNLIRISAHHFGAVARQHPGLHKHLCSYAGAFAKSIANSLPPGSDKKAWHTVGEFETDPAIQSALQVYDLHGPSLGHKENHEAKIAWFTSKLRRRPKKTRSDGVEESIATSVFEYNSQIEHRPSDEFSI